MRGGRTGFAALFFCLCACASPPPQKTTSPAAVEKTAPLPATAVDTPKNEPALREALRVLRELAARPTATDEDRLRFALLLASAGEVEEAERIVSTMKGPGGKLGPYLDLFLRRELGDHREAAKALALLNEEERRATGFVIERAELCARVRRFRDYVTAESDRIAPGGMALLYVEPRNFATRKDGDRHALHLKYEWKLFDDRSVEVPVVAWESADEGQKEDRLTTAGPIREFYQSFKLPLPANLAAGPYRIKVTVTDGVAGKSDRVYVPITVVVVDR